MLNVDPITRSEEVDITWIAANLLNGRTLDADNITLTVSVRTNATGSDDTPQNLLSGSFAVNTDPFQYGATSYPAGTVLVQRVKGAGRGASGYVIDIVAKTNTGETEEESIYVPVVDRR